MTHYTAYSDAAKAFAADAAKGDICTAYDAGHAAALASVTPAEPITTAAQLDALPGSSVVLVDRYAYQKNCAEQIWYLGWSNSVYKSAELVAMNQTITLLAPASPPVPAPVLLTADDPRWKDGAKVRGEFADGTAVEGWLTRRGSKRWAITYGDAFQYAECYPPVIYLLAEAPADPDAERTELLAAALHERGGCEEEWPNCAATTLEHYRAAGRILLARLDAVRADS